MALRPICQNFNIVIRSGKERLCTDSYLCTSLPRLRQARAGLITRTFHPDSFSMFSIFGLQTQNLYVLIKICRFGLLGIPFRILYTDFSVVTARWIVAVLWFAPSSRLGALHSVGILCSRILPLFHRYANWTILRIDKCHFFDFGSRTLRYAVITDSHADILPEVSFLSDPSSFQNAPAE